MIAYIQGILTGNHATYALLEAGGVGYKIYIGTNTLRELPQLLSPCRLYTSLVIRENIHLLYGFCSQAESEFFEQLMTVSGVGPKLALSLLSHLGQDGVRRALVEADLSSLGRVPGIGKKIAQRLVIELREGVRSVDVSGSLHPSAVAALVQLGYKEIQAAHAIQKALQSSGQLESLQEIITASLRHL